MATVTDATVFEGTLHPDGTITLRGKPQVPAGPVQVTIRQLPSQRLPDPPPEDTSISPPCELPRLGPIREITPVALEERFPDPIAVELD